MGGKSSAPAAPNPADTASAQQALNQVNQYSPLGSSVYSPTGQSINGVPTYNQTTTLSPQMQSLFDTQMAQNQGLGNAENALVSQIGQNYGANSTPSMGTNNSTAASKMGRMPAPNATSGGASGGKVGGSSPAAPNPSGSSSMGAPSTGGGGAPPITGGLTPGSFNQWQSNLDTNAGVPTGQLQNAFNQQQGAAYNSQMGYLQPQFTQQTGQLQDQLAQQGITEASNPTAYANAMSLLNNNQTFQSQQAFNNSYQSGLAGANQLFNEGLGNANLNNAAQSTAFQGYAQNAGLNNAANSQYLNQPINQLNALRGATQVQMPTFSQAPQNNNYMNAVQNQYASQLAGYNNQQSGLYGLGASALMAYAMMA